MKKLLTILVTSILFHAPAHAMQTQKDPDHSTSTVAPYIFGAGWALFGLSQAGLKACQSYYEYQHDATIKSIVVDRRTALHRTLYRRLPDDAIAIIKKFDTTDGNALASAEVYSKKAAQAALAFNPPSDFDSDTLPNPCKFLYNTSLIGVGAIVGSGLCLAERNRANWRPFLPSK